VGLRGEAVKVTVLQSYRPVSEFQDGHSLVGPRIIFKGAEFEASEVRLSDDMANLIPALRLPGRNLQNVDPTATYRSKACTGNHSLVEPL